MAQQNNSQSRQQQTAYPSPHSYPSPSMQSTYTYPPPSGGRDSNYDHPGPPNLSLPSLNLPPIRSVDGSQPQHHQQPGGQPLGSPMHAGLMQQGGYYHQGVPPGYNGIPMGVTSPNAQGMRYPLPPGPPAPDPRMMSGGGRNKKEIKRRTKTGCLTCRKRRIKCDEGHPVCRNCQKSKRECLGYDPIFKQQPSPAAIQPAPNSNTPAHSIPASSAPPSSSYSSVPQGYAPAGSSNLTPGLDGSPSSSVDHSYDYNSAIDPALAGGDSGTMAGASPFDANQAYRSDLNRVLENGSPYSSAASDAAPPKPKRVLKIDDLFMIGGDPPTPAPSKDIPPDMYDEIRDLYSRVYAKGIDAFLETSWYSAKGLDFLVKDVGTCEMFQAYVEQLRTVKSEDYDGMRKIPGHEARVVWALMCLSRTSAVQQHTAEPTSDEQLNTVHNRLAVFENLITGHTMESNLLSPAATIHQLSNSKRNELDFWNLLGKFVSLRDDEASTAREIDNTLVYLRQILSQKENRDVLYSMAIVRHIGSRIDESDRNAVPNSQDEQNRNKVQIAKSFIEDEAAGKGTTQVIQRLCGMAARGWMATR